MRLGWLVFVFALAACSEKKKIAQAQADVEMLQKELDAKAPYSMGTTPTWAECPDEVILSKKMDPWGRAYWIEQQTLPEKSMFVSFRCVLVSDGPDRVKVTDDIRPASVQPPK
jgi:hypothetical protein